MCDGLILPDRETLRIYLNHYDFRSVFEYYGFRVYDIKYFRVIYGPKIDEQPGLEIQFSDLQQKETYHYSCNSVTFFGLYLPKSHMQVAKIDDNQLWYFDDRELRLYSELSLISHTSKK